MGWEEGVKDGGVGGGGGGKETRSRVSSPRQSVSVAGLHQLVQ